MNGFFFWTNLKIIIGRIIKLTKRADKRQQERTLTRKTDLSLSRLQSFLFFFNNDLVLLNQRSQRNNQELLYSPFGNALIKSLICTLVAHIKRARPFMVLSLYVCLSLYYLLIVDTVGSTRAKDSRRNATTYTFPLYLLRFRPSGVTDSR